MKKIQSTIIPMLLACILDGNGYGGGNCDVNTAIELGKRASKYGMSVCVDFHYSDFWADPSKQFEPKSWVGMSLEEKSDALYSFTKESLEKMLKEGIDISMVQIGNEATAQEKPHRNDVALMFLFFPLLDYKLILCPIQKATLPWLFAN